MSNYTKDGYRVIALAMKVLPQDLSYTDVMRIDRSECEQHLIFLGLLIMENKLKQETNAVISNLNECSIRTIMATGDNVLTAISVARQCSILQQESEVYFGDVVTNKRTGIEIVEWKSSKPVNEDLGF